MTNENLYTKDCIRTFTDGNYLNLMDIDLEKILIEDIAHSLSKLPRFGGHMKANYSVAQHSIWIAKKLEEAGQDKNICLCGLLHDAPEAYMMDIPSPIKKMLPDYIKLENEVMTSIANKFSLIYPFPDVIKEMDKIALEFEWENGVLNDNLNDEDWLIVKNEFIELFHKFQ